MEPNVSSPHFSSDASPLSCLLHPHCSFLPSFLSFIHSVFSFSPFCFTPPFLHQCCCCFFLICSFSVSVCALCPAASESVLLQQLFQSKLTPTGSLVPAAHGRAGLRGPKAALLLHRRPPAAPITANIVPQRSPRCHDLTEVQYTLHWSLQIFCHQLVYSSELLKQSRGLCSNRAPHCRSMDTRRW